MKKIILKADLEGMERHFLERFATTPLDKTLYGKVKIVNKTNSNKTMMIELGSEVKDTISGFVGIAVARCTWIHGCVRLCVESYALHEGKPVEGVWFDQNRLEMINPPAQNYRDMTHPVPHQRAELGSVVQDTITGFSGIVVAIGEGLTGAPRVIVESSKLHEGKPIAPQSFDEGRVARVSGPRKKIAETMGKPPTAGPFPDPKPPRVPPRSASI